MKGDLSTFTCPDCGAVFDDFFLCATHKTRDRCLVRAYEREGTLLNRIAFHSVSPTKSFWARITRYDPDKRVATCRLIQVDHVQKDGSFRITCGAGHIEAHLLELTTMEHLEHFLDMTISDSLGKICWTLGVPQ